MLSSQIQAIVCVIASLLGRDIAFAKSFSSDLVSGRHHEISGMKNVKFSATMFPEVAVTEPLFQPPQGGKGDYYALKRSGGNHSKSLPVVLSWRGGAIAALQAYFAESKTRCWFILLLAIFVDTGSAALMKAAQDEGSFPKLAVSYFTYFLSLYGFSLSLKNLDVSIAYAVWAALGTAIVSGLGIVLFNESYDMMKLGCLLMIVLGVVGLNLRESH